MPKHTPGPWVEEGNGEIWGDADGECLVCEVSPNIAIKPESRQAADVKLIMAAPKLLERLIFLSKEAKRCLEKLQDRFPGISQDEFWKTWNETVALIIEAGGSLDE